MFERFAADARRAVVLAQGEAVRDGSRRVEPRHLALGALEQPDVVDLLGDAAAVLAGKLRRPEGRPGAGGRIPFADATKTALEQSLRLCLHFDHVAITSVHVFLGAASAGDPDVDAAMRLGEIDLPAVMTAASGRPAVAPDSMTAGQLRTLRTESRRGDAGHDDLGRQLVVALINEGNLAAAVREAFELSDSGVPAVARELVILGELTGDVGVVVEHGETALSVTERSPAFLATFGLALAHAGRFDEGRRMIDDACRAVADERTLMGCRLDRVEVDLLSGDVEAASRRLAELEPPDAAEMPLLRMLWMRLALDLGRARGEIPEVGPAPIAPDGILERFYRLALDVRLLEADLDHVTPSAVAKGAARIRDEDRGTGFLGVAADAQCLRGRVLRSAGKRRWRRTLDEAATELEYLGRSVLAGRARREMEDT